MTFIWSDFIDIMKQKWCYVEHSGWLMVIFYHLSLQSQMRRTEMSWWDVKQHVAGRVMFHVVFPRLCMKFSVIGSICGGRWGKCFPDWSADSLLDFRWCGLFSCPLCWNMHMCPWSLYLMQFGMLIVGLQLFSLVKLVVSSLSSHCWSNL